MTVCPAVLAGKLTAGNPTKRFEVQSQVDSLSEV